MLTHYRFKPPLMLSADRTLTYRHVGQRLGRLLARVVQWRCLPWTQTFSRTGYNTSHDHNMSEKETGSISYWLFLILKRKLYSTSCSSLKIQEFFSASRRKCMCHVEKKRFKAKTTIRFKKAIYYLLYFLQAVKITISEGTWITVASLRSMQWLGSLSKKKSCKLLYADRSKLWGKPFQKTGRVEKWS